MKELKTTIIPLKDIPKKNKRVRKKTALEEIERYYTNYDRSATKENASVSEKVAGKHYDIAEGIETISIIESIVSRESIERQAAYSIGNAVKYLIRSGSKPGEDWRDDVAKAKNYLNRALTGKWESK